MEEKKINRALIVGRWYMLLVTFILGVFCSFGLLYFMIQRGDPSPWMEGIILFCAGFFLSTTLLRPGDVIVEDQLSRRESQ